MPFKTIKFHLGFLFSGMGRPVYEATMVAAPADNLNAQICTLSEIITSKINQACPASKREKILRVFKQLLVVDSIERLDRLIDALHEIRSELAMPASEMSPSSAVESSAQYNELIYEIYQLAIDKRLDLSHKMTKSVEE